jgi:predicted nucleic acid-binding protein
VKVLFDTSVLIPAIVTRHDQHAICWRWLEDARSDQFQGVVSTHTLAELRSE